MTDFTIRWVTTPPCARCIPTREQLRRYPCIGCPKLLDNLRGAPATRSEPPDGKHRLRVSLQKTRDAKIVSLHLEGLSLAQTAKKLGIPRSTVNNALLRWRGANGTPGPKQTKRLPALNGRETASR